MWVCLQTDEDIQIHLWDQHDSRDHQKTQNNNELTYIFKYNKISLNRYYVGNTLVVPYLFVKHISIYKIIYFQVGCYELL